MSYSFGSWRDRGDAVSTAAARGVVRPLSRNPWLRMLGLLFSGTAFPCAKSWGGHKASESSFRNGHCEILSKSWRVWRMLPLKCFWTEVGAKKEDSEDDNAEIQLHSYYRDFCRWALYNEHEISPLNGNLPFSWKRKKQKFMCTFFFFVLLCCASSWTVTRSGDQWWVKKIKQNWGTFFLFILYSAGGIGQRLL